MDKVISELKQAVVEYLRNQDNTPYISSSKGDYTTHELVAEVENETEVGIHILRGLIQLSTDLVIRGKQSL
jgi:hypothetical protein